MSKAKAKKITRKPRKTLKLQLADAVEEGRRVCAAEEFERANARGVTHAIKLNAELQKIQQRLTEVSINVSTTSNLLAEIIRENTPKPRGITYKPTSKEDPWEAMGGMHGDDDD